MRQERASSKRFPLCLAEAYRLAACVARTCQGDYFADPPALPVTGGGSVELRLSLRRSA